MPQHRKGPLWAATAAGLALVGTLGPAVPALAASGSADTPVKGESANPEYLSQLTATSTGDTKLYVKKSEDDLTTSEGSATSNIKVTIPVAIHYVADSEGRLTGPSDGVVHFTNNTRTGAVHISKIQVSAVENVTTIAKMAEVGNVDDRVGLTMTPGSGTADELGNYLTKGDPKNKGEWDVAQKGGTLYLNKLGGRIGGFDKVDPATDTVVGGIHWTVRAGTRAQADERDDTLTIHYNSNDGYNANCVPVADSTVRVSATSGAITTDPDVEGPRARTNADGTVTTWSFEGWYTDPTGGTKVTTASEAIAAAGGDGGAGGSVLELYAHYTSTTA